MYKYQKNSRNDVLNSHDHYDWLRESTISDNIAMSNLKIWKLNGDFWASVLRQWLFTSFSGFSPTRPPGEPWERDFNGLDDLRAGCNVGYIPLSES